MTTTNPGGRPLGFQYGTSGPELDPIWVMIHKVRVERGLTALEVATMAHVATSTISRGERGYRTWLDKTRAVAQALGINIAASLPDPPTTTAELHEDIDEGKILYEPLSEAA